MPEFLNGATAEPYRLEVYTVDDKADKATLKVFNIDNGDQLLEREVDLSSRARLFGLDMADMITFQLMAEDAIDAYEAGQVQEDASA